MFYLSLNKLWDKTVLLNKTATYYFITQNKVCTAKNESVCSQNCCFIKFVGPEPASDPRIVISELCSDLTHTWTGSLTPWTPGCHFTLLCSQISSEGGSTVLWHRLYVNLPLAIWHQDHSHSWRQCVLPWVLPPVLVLDIQRSTLKLNLCPVSSVPSTTLTGGRRGRDGKWVDVTVELFQLSSEPQDEPWTCHESYCWQRLVWVLAWREEFSVEGEGHLSPLNQHLPISRAYWVMHYKYRQMEH